MENQELDSMVARLVWGYVVIIDTQSGLNYIMGHDHVQIELPKFSEDQEAANMVEKKMEENGWILTVRNTIDEAASKWLASFLRRDNKQYKLSSADTVPRAICLAAVSAMQGTNIKQ